jgi:hypothetical protein
MSRSFAQRPHAARMPVSRSRAERWRSKRTRADPAANQSAADRGPMPQQLRPVLAPEILPPRRLSNPYGLAKAITLCLVKNKLLENRQMGSSGAWEIKATRVDSLNVGRSPAPLRAPAKLAIVGVYS